MEHLNHLCHQCGAEVEEGNPFCRKCGAPQIRVNRETVEQQASPAQPDFASDLASNSSAAGAQGRSTIDRRIARRQAALAGLLLALILATGLGFSLALLLIPLAGMLAVQLYYRKLPEQKLSLGKGAGIGLLTGFFGFLIFSLPAFPFLLWQVALHPDPALIQQLRAQIEATARNSPNPQAQQMMNSLLTPGGLVFICIMIFVLLLLLTLALSAIGGAIGAGLPKRRP